LFEPFHGLPDTEIRPKGSCGLLRGGALKPAGRSWWPCGCGIRGGVCEQYGWAEMCVSRLSPNAVEIQGPLYRVLVRASQSRETPRARPFTPW
jgi:hypothetical protein